MNKFIWKEEYSVGIPSIDEQHRHFFGITNEIIDLGEKSAASREELQGVADQLGDYALYHLKTEEDYFDKVAYPEAPQHVDAHNLYRQKIADYLARVDNPATDLTGLAEELAAYSVSWLSEHILLVDKKYTKYFQEHGIK
jgi:hemerythrin